MSYLTMSMLGENNFLYPPRDRSKTVIGSPKAHASTKCDDNRGQYFSVIVLTDKQSVPKTKHPYHGGTAHDCS